jgi:asparagine synthetase B (glutamine-hydrolysing)
VCKLPKRHFQSTTDSSASIGVLFSGGIDCAVLALLAAKYLPESESIDLINVAVGPALNSCQRRVLPSIAGCSSSSAAASSIFGTPESDDIDFDKVDALYSVPDRLAAINALCELSYVIAYLLPDMNFFFMFSVISI